MGGDDDAHVGDDDTQMDDDQAGDDDETGTPDDDTDDECTGFEFTMVSPQNGDTNVTPSSPIIFSWNQQPDGVFAHLRDSGGSFVQQMEQETSGNEVSTWYAMVYDQTYHFDAGYHCHTATIEEQIQLIDVSFRTTPFSGDDDDSTPGDDDDSTPGDDDDGTPGDDDDFTPGDDDDATPGDDDDTGGSCQPCVGDYDVSDPGATNCSSISGTLTNSGIMSSVLLPCLESAGSIFFNGSIFLADATFPVLESVSGDLTISANYFLTNLNLPNVVTVGGDFNVSSNNALLDFSAPNLADVGGSYTILSNMDLSSFDSSNLVSVGLEVNIQENDSLAEFQLPRLVDTGVGLYDMSFVVHGNDALYAFECSDLSGIGGDLLIQENGSLMSFEILNVVSLPADMSIVSNGALASLAGLGSLNFVGGNLSVLSNDCLNQAEVDAFVLPIFVGGASIAYSNGAHYPCP